MLTQVQMLMLWKIVGKQTKIKLTFIINTMFKHEGHWWSQAMVHCCEGITNYKHIWSNKESSIYTH